MKRTIACLALCLMAGLPQAQETPSATPLFTTTLTDLEDRPAALARFKGKPLIVNFWASWCAPCRAEIPELNTFRTRHKGNIEVLGIGIEDDADIARQFQRKNPMQYPVFIAKEQGIPLMKALGNTKGGLPYTLFIDRNGLIVNVKLGLLKKADLDNMEATLLKK